MARRRAKKTVKKVESSPVNHENDVVENEAQFDKEVERQSGAIRAIRDVEIEHLLTELRLLRSYFSKEQLQTPTMQFFKENLPNLSVVGTEGNKQFEVQWNDRESKVSMNLMKETYTHLFCASCPWFILTALLLLHLWVL